MLIIAYTWANVSRPLTSIIKSDHITPIHSSLIKCLPVLNHGMPCASLAYLTCLLPLMHHHLLLQDPIWTTLGDSLLHSLLSYLPLPFSSWRSPTRPEALFLSSHMFSALSKGCLGRNEEKTGQPVVLFCFVFKDVRVTEREKQVFSPLVHCSDGCDSWSLAKLKIRARSFL